jgi:hypothetical protein
VLDHIRGSVPIRDAALDPNREAILADEGFSQAGVNFGFYLGVLRSGGALRRGRFRLRLGIFSTLK